MKPKTIKAEDGVSGANVGDIIDYGNGVYRRVSEVTKWENSGRFDFRRVSTEPCDKDGNVPFAPRVGMLVERKHKDGRVEVVRITKVIPVTIGGLRGWKWIGRLVSDSTKVCNAISQAKSSSDGGATEMATSPDRGNNAREEVRPCRCKRGVFR